LNVNPVRENKTIFTLSAPLQQLQQEQNLGMSSRDTTHKQGMNQQYTPVHVWVVPTVSAKQHSPLPAQNSQPLFATLETSFPWDLCESVYFAPPVVQPEILYDSNSMMYNWQVDNLSITS